MAEAAALVDIAEALDARGRPALALEHWRRAYDLSSDPTLLLEVARLESDAGNFARAAHALEQFLQRGTARVTPERTRWAAQELRITAASTARLLLETNVPGASVDLERGRGVASGSGFVVTLLLDAGERKLVLSKPGYEAQAFAVSLAPGEARSLRVHLEKAAGGQSNTFSNKPRWARLETPRPVR